MAKKTKEVSATLPDTSTEYNTLIGHKEMEGRPGSLSSFLGLTDIPESEEEAWHEHNLNNWREHWVGLPAYESTNLEPEKQLIVSFRTKEDFLAFSSVIGQQLTLKTRSVWYPERARDENSLKRWLEIEDD